MVGLVQTRLCFRPPPYRSRQLPVLPKYAQRIFIRRATVTVFTRCTLRTGITNYYNITDTKKKMQTQTKQSKTKLETCMPYKRMICRHDSDQAG